MDADPRPTEAWDRPIDISVFARPPGPEYLEAVRWVESLECNRPHEDKSWVARVEENNRRYFASVRRAERT
jgi:hypothetical protein